MTQQDSSQLTEQTAKAFSPASPKEHPLPLEKTVEALVDALFPPGKNMPAGDAAEIVAKLRSVCGDRKAARFAVGVLLSLIELRSPMMSGKWFRSLSSAERQQQLRKLSRTLLVRALSAPLKMAYLISSDVLKATDSRYGLDSPNQPEQERWLQQITTPSECEDTVELEADVVVVGSGAGGAVAAYELARRGLAVLIIEEGKHYQRRDFDGGIYRLGPKLYRANGATVALGKSTIPIPIGKSVGGTTTINSGTCLRTPDRILADWRKTGLSEFSPELMAPHFNRVEQILEVCPADRTAVGPIYDALKKGVDAVGMSGLHVLPRNAPDCDGQGLCQFGCPTGAKRSTNVSYIPKALSAGASLFAEFRADRLLFAGARVKGITARGKSADGRKVQLSVKADRVVLSLGTLMTPLFLRNNGIDNKNVGRHLSIHPAGAVSGHFPGRHFRNGSTIPQGIGIDDLADDGIMFEGGTPPLQAYGLARPGLGSRFVESIENYQNSGIFGFMIRDDSRGTVRRSPLPGLPFITYTMNKKDLAQFIRATGLAARILLRAGAEQVLIPGRHGSPMIGSEDDLDAFLRRPLKQKHLMVTAYHPLGTARIAADPTQGVCDDRHRVFGRQGLYVIDGSSVPSSLGVNPQITIMSMATRAAGLLADEALAN